MAIIKFQKKDHIDNDFVSVDFAGIDRLRETLRKIVFSLNKKQTGTGRRWRKGVGSWDRSAFYVGRGVTRVSFSTLYVSGHQMSKVVASLKETEAGVGTDCYVNGLNLHVYIRGVRKA